MRNEKKSNRAEKIMRYRLALLIGITFALTVVTFKAGAGGASSGQAIAFKARMTMEERVSYQRAIEEVYWRHRVWPEANSRPKPELDEVMSISEIRARVEDYLSKSEALDLYWQRPVTGEALQAEVTRMAAQTRKPEMLRQLWAALGNDPYVIAECLARPALAARLAQNWYSHDERYHGELKSRIESELARIATSGQARQLSGKYRETEWVKSDSAKRDNQPTTPGRDVTLLSSGEWDQSLAKLAQAFGDQSDKITAGRLTRLQEGEDRFYVLAVIEKSNDRLKMLSVDWEKESFDSWWSRARGEIQMKESALSYQYSLPEINSTAASDGWSPTAAAAPASRTNHSAVWTGTEMIIWGGVEGSSCCSNLLPVQGARYNPVTDIWSAISVNNAPNARSSHTAVWTGTEMIVWGGQDNFNRYNTGGRYNPASNSWTGINTAGAPLPRTSHSAVWTGSQMIVWGGSESGSCCSSSLLNTGGRYNPVTDSWSATSTPNAPTARGSHRAVWTGSEMIVWGGSGNNGSINTGGRYNPATNNWTGTNTAGAPLARANHTAVWTGSDMIIWGGSASSGCCSLDSSGGKYNPATDSWTATSLVGAPSGRTNHTAVWTGSVMIIWGGSNFSTTGGRYSPGTDSWTATSTTNAPSDRTGHTAIWTGSEMIIWGGASFSGAIVGARYSPSSNNWLAISNSVAPTVRERHTAVWTGAEMIIWGGFGSIPFSNPGPLNTGGRYVPALDNWVATNTSNPPVARYNHTAIWTGSEMIVWGGYDGSNVLNSGGHYNPSSNTWFQTSQANVPPAIYQHTAVWTGSEMIVWGGSDGFNYSNLGGRYNPASTTWLSTNLLNAPSARDSHTAVWTGTEMIVWGGFNSSLGYLSSGSRYNPGSNSWTAVSSTNAPTARINHTAVWADTVMIVWGGSDSANRLNTGGRYNPASNSWTATSLVNAPSPRSQHTAVLGEPDMIVWGGSDGVNQLNTGSQYNIIANGWATTTTVNAPSARERHTAVWTGNEMIVWGGSDGAGQLNTGSRFLPPLCAFFLSMTNQFCSAGGGECNVNVTTPGGCNWTASSDVGWITVYDGESGNGNGVVSFVIRENLTAEPRVGTLHIAGRDVHGQPGRHSRELRVHAQPCVQHFLCRRRNRKPAGSDREPLRVGSR